MQPRRHNHAQHTFTRYHLSARAQVELLRLLRHSHARRVAEALHTGKEVILDLACGRGVSKAETAARVEHELMYGARPGVMP